MANSMSEMLRRDLDCEGLLECFHGLTELDQRVFRALVEGDGALTVDEIAAAVDRERSTAYRSVQRLVRTGFVVKEQVNYDHGGYYHVFRPADPDAVADDMQRMLNDWYAKMGQLVAEFREEYDHEPPTETVPAEN